MTAHFTFSNGKCCEYNARFAFFVGTSCWYYHMVVHLNIIIIIHLNHTLIHALRDRDICIYAICHYEWNNKNLHPFWFRLRVAKRSVVIRRFFIALLVFKHSDWITHPPNWLSTFMFGWFYKRSLRFGMWFTLHTSTLVHQLVHSGNVLQKKVYGVCLVGLNLRIRTHANCKHTIIPLRIHSLFYFLLVANTGFSFSPLSSAVLLMW